MAAAVALLGGRAALLTKLGNDRFGDYLTDTLCRVGVDCSFVRRTADAHTSLAFVHLKKDGDREFTFYRSPGADMLFSPGDLDSAALEDCGIFHFGSVDLIECPMKYAHIRAIEMAKKRGALISFDPNIRLPLWEDAEICRQTVRDFLSYADLVKLSDEECAFVTGYADPDRAAAWLFRCGVKWVLISLGKKGALLYTKKKRVRADLAGMLPAVDTTGAGDCLMGAFLFALAREDGDLEDRAEEALIFANTCAAISVRSHGAIPSYPQSSHPDLAHWFSERTELRL